MTIDYRIGNAELRLMDGTWSAYVETVELDEAPAFPGSIVSRHASRISIPYSSEILRNSCFRTFLSTLNPDQHEVGALALKPEHLEAINAAVTDFQIMRPDAIPSFDEMPDNGTLARLMLFAWWIEWALKHCDRPAIHVS